MINADKTGFQILLASIQNRAYKIAKNAVVNTLESDKDRIFIMSSIISDYDRLLLFYI